MEPAINKNRILALFERKQTNLLSVFYTAGFPSLNDTVDIAVALERSGADIIEIGIPFSDPVADGPVIQESNKVALENGMTVKKLLLQVREIREKEVALPVLLMGYLNPILQYGVEEFCKEAAESGVDGIILPDLPMDEYQRDFKGIVESYGMCNTFLISPTTSAERIRTVDDNTKGFIYAVSSSSITGGKDVFSDAQLEYFKRLKDMKLNSPFLIGFGISNNEGFRQACTYSSGAIVGSSFISWLKDKRDIRDFVNRIKHDGPVDKM